MAGLGCLPGLGLSLPVRGFGSVPLSAAGRGILLSAVFPDGFLPSFLCLRGGGLRLPVRVFPPYGLTQLRLPGLLAGAVRPRGAFSLLRLSAGLGAILVVLRTRSAVLVIVVGMLVLWGLRWLAS